MILSKAQNILPMLIFKKNHLKYKDNLSSIAVFRITFRFMSALQPLVLVSNVTYL